MPKDAARASRDARLKDIANELQMLRHANDLETVGLQVANASQAIGFDHYSLLQRDHAKTDVGSLKLDNLPAEWKAVLDREQLYLDDPVFAAMAEQTVPYRWSDLGELITLCERHLAYIRTANSLGMTHGFSVPIHAPGEASWLCSFVMNGETPLPEEALPLAQFLASHAHNAARRIVSKQQPQGNRALSDIERRVILELARGRSKWLTSRSLGIPPAQVQMALKNAKRSYGVGTEAELVVHALFDKSLDFAAVLH